MSAAMTAFLVAPARINPEKAKPFVGRNYAHRGLHKQDKSIPENSLSAFSDAAESGYGIELDVRLTSDDRVVVFLDRSLERLCGVKGEIGKRDWGYLKNLSLPARRRKVPLLSEALSVIGGRVPF
jgi:glycerophosphoryl diester phosphodiesterase